jgi:serine protease Do
MKRLFRLSLIPLLALAGCSRAPQTTAALPEKPDAELPAEAAADLTPEGVLGGPVDFKPARGSLLSSAEVPLLEQINRENARVVNAALPSIVRITATRPIDPRLKFFGSEMPFQLPFGSGARRYAPSNDTAYGSGIVLSKDGYILTNNHVIEDSNLLQVQLADKRLFDARVVASDDLVDVAVLKVDATGLLPLPWGNSDRVQVGEQVFAIGNPFDLTNSVSKGIVSAKGRNLPHSSEDDDHYEDYIQTDAAINPGNSGGALVNIHGELIGLNAAIASTTRVNMGIGFAIPSNLVRYAVEGLLKEGHLVRGYLGVILPDSVDEGVVSQLDLKSSEGAFLAGIQPDSPAEKAKLHAFDFITAVDGHKIDSEADLRLVVAQVPIGKQVSVDYVRDGKPESTEVQIAEIPRDDEQASSSGNPTGDEETPPQGVKGPASPANVLSGLQVTDLNDKTRQKFVVDPIVTWGVVVNGVQEGSVADAKGIARGDVIESVSVKRGATQNLETSKDFTTLTGDLKPDQSVVLLVHDRERGNNFVYLAAPVK